MWGSKNKEKEKVNTMPAGDGIGPYTKNGRRRMTGYGPGGPDFCVCSSCGFQVQHTRGVPCASMICPKCQAKMIRGILSEKKL